MTIIVDPAIRILPDDHRIFVLHPGEGKRFYGDFQATESVFLDLPGVSFATPPDMNDTNLRNKLRMAKRIGIWRRRGSKVEDTPSRNPDDYAVTTVAADTPRFVHEVHDLYTEAKAGDLIIVPGKGYGSTVFFGEVVNDFDPDFTVESHRYPGETIPARKVKWLPVNLAKQQFNRRLVKLMQNRQAIIQVTREDDRREIYTHAYGDYVWKESSGNLIRVTKNDIDLNDLNKAVDLANYFASQYIALKKGEIQQFLDMDFHDAIDSYYDKSYFGGVNVEIHSPGFFGRPMKKAAMAGYVSAMLALSGAGVSAQEAADTKVLNSANTVVSICDMELEADIRQTMEMYANIHLWEDDVCPRREATKDSVGLKTDVTVKKEAPPAGN
ncbi:hypothetical protein [Mesorhizobium sp. CO1-1-4]|uniref:hypothetical protein n=1 Tax=Mesorhizobium sp. CO1-1-4 TaxID=2876633 RepID=UPI001CCF7DD9|nr:hypothetical protein [Mesorhizobium sp. CO1-1-4]MBZ9742353.1 hypothetical protein [Mesorhizobium sp. CO1-1-4]